MKTKKAFYSVLSIALAFVLAFALVAIKGPSIRSIGSFTLRVNPELRISYNKDGNVTKIEAKNEDGQKILDACKSFRGVSCDEAVQTLLNSIYANGYFENTIDGNQRNIVLILDPNSKLPNDSFLESLRNDAEQTGESLHLTSNVVDISQNDFAPQAPKNETATTNCLTLEKAKSIALAQVGVDPAEAKFISTDLDREAGFLVYELEFVAGGLKHEYDIDASNGTILKAEHSVMNRQKPSGPVTPSISLEEAKAIALKHAGVSAANAKFDEKECEFNKHDGKYEVKFTNGKYVYSFDIDAVTGAILEAEQKDAAYVAAQKAEEAQEDAMEAEKEAEEDAQEAKKDALEDLKDKNDKFKDALEDIDDDDDDDEDDDDDNDIDDDDDDDDEDDD